MPRFSQRRRSKRRMTRSKRGGAINIPDTGLTKPISIYYLNPKYNDDPNNKIKKYKLKPQPIEGRQRQMCEVIDTDTGFSSIDFCDIIKQNALSEEEYFKGNEEYRKNLLMDAKANNANTKFYESEGANDRDYSLYGGNLRRVKRRRRTQKKQRR
jgi:hypothetical protein